MARRKFTEKKGFRFPGTPPKDALAYFRDKDLRVGFSYRDVWGAEHAHAFTVAKMMQLDLLEEVRSAVGKALEQGQTFRQFERGLTPLLQKRGWWGEKKVLDPKTGKTVRVQLGSPRRLRTIYRANLRSARAAGQWQRIRRTRSTHPYLLYELGPSENHRPQHAAWAGTILPADDPWWHDHFPPNGWGCKCRVRQLSRREAERRGGVSPRPARHPVEWVDRRTGRRMKIDRGLDPAWARNPGRDRDRILADGLAGRIDRADQALARAAVRQVADSALLDRQLAEAKPGDLPKGDLPIAFLAPELRDHLGAKTQVVRLTQKAANKQRRKHSGVQIDDYRRLPSVLHEESQSVFLGPPHWKRKGLNLYFFYRKGKDLWKAVVAEDGVSHARLASFHRTNEKHLEAVRKRSIETIRDGLLK